MVKENLTVNYLTQEEFLKSAKKSTWLKDITVEIIEKQSSVLIDI
jgi:hypothetical protein